MPTVRAPASLASWPTTEPTAPVAADTSTVSPAFGAMILFRPYQAVTPGMPSGAEIGLDRNRLRVDHP